MFTPIFGSLGTVAVGILTVLTMCGLSFIKGMAYEGDRRLAAEAKALENRKAIVRVVDHETVKIETRYIVRKQQRDKEQQTATSEVIQHAQTIPDPKQCWLDDRRVRNINAAWGIGLDANPPEQAPAVPAPSTPVVGKPQ